MEPWLSFTFVIKTPLVIVLFVPLSITALLLGGIPLIFFGGVGGGSSVLNRVYNFTVKHLEKGMQVGDVCSTSNSIMSVLRKCLILRAKCSE